MANNKELTKAEQDLINRAQKALTENQSIAEFLGIKDKELETLYALGHGFYSQGKFDKAESIFHFLCMSKGDHFDYWKALAGAFQMNKKYDQAIQAYAFCHYLNMEDADIPFQAGHCFLEKGDLKNAESAFFAAHHFASQNKKYAEVEKRAGLFLETIAQKAKMPQAKK